MKMKYFIRGLGVGIIITALLLCIFYRKQMTDTAIIHKAKALGMDFVGKSQQEDAVSAGAVTAHATANPTPTKTSEGSPSANPKASQTAKPSTKTTKKPAVSPTVKPSDKPVMSNVGNGSYHVFTIERGLLSSSVAKQMQKAGIIDSAAKFDHYLTQKGYGDRILTGKFKIPKGATYSEIAKIIVE